MSREPLSPDREPFIPFPPGEPRVRFTWAEWSLIAIALILLGMSLWIGWNW